MEKLNRTDKHLMKTFLLKGFMISMFLTFLTTFSYGEDVKKKGKIIFTNDASVLGEVTLENAKESFNLMDDLYLRVFLNEPLSHYYDKFNYDYDFDSKRYTYNYAFRIKIDGKPQSKFLDETSEEGFNTARTLAFPLSTGDKTLKRDYSGLINHWVRIIENMEPGEHKVKIEVVPYTLEIVGEDLPVLASGEFDLTIKSGEMAQFIAKNELNLPEPTMQNSEIENKIVVASDGIVRRAEPVKALITDVTEDWNYTYDENGNILYRHIVASVVYRLTDDKSCIVNSAIYSQKHQGYGDFGPMMYSKDAEGYYDYQVPCDVVVAQEESSRTLDIR